MLEAEEPQKPQYGVSLGDWPEVDGPEAEEPQKPNGELLLGHTTIMRQVLKKPRLDRVQGIGGHRRQGWQQEAGRYCDLLSGHRVQGWQ